MTPDFRLPIRRALSAPCRTDLLGKFTAGAGDKKPTEGASRTLLGRIMRVKANISLGFYPNASDLAADLAVCTKTIYRDVAFLKTEFGVPIQWDAVRNGFCLKEAQ